MKVLIPYFLGQQVPKIEYDLIGNKNLSENRNWGKDTILKITSYIHSYSWNSIFARICFLLLNERFLI